MRVKSYLTTRGVEFDALDVTSNKAAADELAANGIKLLPVVSKGKRYVHGGDLKQVDELVGLKVDNSRFSGEEIVSRTIRVVEAWARYTKQLPLAHYDDPTPGMEGMTTFVVAGKIARLSDGTPFIPHGSSMGIARHIYHHLATFQLMTAEPNSPIFQNLIDYAEYKEPLPSQSADELIAEAEMMLDKIRGWWDETKGRTLDDPVQAYNGPQTVYSMLVFDLYSLTAHTRQLMTRIQELGIEPNGPIGEAEYSGLKLPPNVWS